MSSSVFFRFKSQKEPSRIAFDGTGISVFELKREIIALNRLGDGTDFELIVSSEDNNEEYDDDTAIIPRSTTVVAKRLPAAKAGRGGAARYVSGKIPLNAKNSHRSETQPSKSSGKNQGSDVSNGTMNFTELKTEEERIAAMFKLSNDQWEQQQQEMANATPIHRGGPIKGKPVNVPDHPPPSGYICYRCGEKGHWIHVCPTNTDPNFDGRPRIKRTTGIPRSFLKTVEKPTVLGNDGTVDDSKQPSGVMVNADGEWVVAEPDQASWEQYRSKTKVSASAQEAAARCSKELQDKGLECSIDKRLFIEPTKTPCCQKTYCNECITNALLDNDFQCPSCGKDSVLIDDLIPDDDVVAKIRSFEKEKSMEQEHEKAKSPPVKQEALPQTLMAERKSKSPGVTHASSVVPSAPVVNGKSKKRTAETELLNKHTPSGPFQRPSAGNGQVHDLNQKRPNQSTKLIQETSSDVQAPFLNNNFMNTLGMNTMTFPGNGFDANSMTMAPMMGISTGIMDPRMMPNGAFTSGLGNWGSINQPSFPQHNGLYGNAFQGSMAPNLGYGSSDGQVQLGNNVTRMNCMATFNQGVGHFSNQQRTTFSSPQPNEEDSAYFRKPVNPYRHQGRRNANRPTDYREI